MMKLINISKNKYLFLLLLGVFVLTPAGLCYGLNSAGGQGFWTDENGNVCLSIDAENPLLVAETSSAVEPTASDSDADSSGSNIFDPGMMAAIRQIISNNEGSELSAASVEALQALGLSQAAITGIGDMLLEHPGSVQSLTAEQLTAAADDSTGDHQWLFCFLVLAAFGVVIGWLLHIIIRKPPGSRNKTV